MTTKDTVLIALFAALMVVLSLMPPLPLPAIPVPLTLQTLGAMLAGCLLGPRRGALACLLYLGLAALGLPVLPGGRGGVGVFAGPTGGFLIGLVVGAGATGALARWFISSSCKRRHWRVYISYAGACVVGSIALIYACGVPWLAAITGMRQTEAWLAVVVFLPGDLVKALVAAWVATAVQRVI